MYGFSNDLDPVLGFNRKWVAAYEARRRGDRRLCLKLLRELTRGYVGITDLPGIGFLPELRELYPDARVVLVTRDPRRWWRSLGVLGRNATRWYLPYLTAPVPGWRWIPVLIRQYAESGRDLLGLRPGEADVGDNRGPGEWESCFLNGERERERERERGGGLHDWRANEPTFAGIQN